jgi:hypothetical protein
MGAARSWELGARSWELENELDCISQISGA